jgi:hypothetical protein
MLIQQKYALGLSAVMALVAGCSSQSDAPSRNPVDKDAGDAAEPSASDGHRDTGTHVSDAQVVDATSTADSSPVDAAVEGACHRITTECAGVDVLSSLSTTCVEVGATGDRASCEALEDECAQYCLGAAFGDAGADSGAQAEAPNAEQCGVMGEACHAFDEGRGLGHLCHEVGHARDLVVCGAIYDECEALCGEFPSDEDAAHGHEATDAAHGDAAHGHEATDAAHGDAAHGHEATDAAHDAAFE